MFEEPPRYCYYLLWIWEERSEDPNIETSWRFRLENPRDGKRRSFTDLEDLFEALKNELAHLNQ
jgi:hypothetical protein